MMGQSLPVKETHRRRTVAASVANQFGVDAPYPNGIIRAKYFDWTERVNRFESARVKFEALLAEASSSPGKVKDLDRCYRAMRATAVYRDRLRLPKHYLSWAHIAAFLTPQNGAENDIRRSASASHSAEIETRSDRVPEPATTQ